MGKFMTMPKLDMSMEEGVIVSWLVKKGDRIKRGDIVVEIETGKLSLEVDNPTADGTVIELYAGEGDTVPVNNPIMFIGEPGEVPPAFEPEAEGRREVPSPASVEVSEAGSDWDIAVIGGGPGGYVCAIRAAQLGAKAVLFEKASPGGVCLNRGCIPTKSLAHSASIWRMINSSEDSGISISGASFDWNKIISRKDSIVGSLVNGVEGLLSDNGVEVIRAEAVLCRSGEITAGGRRFRAESTVLACGSLPVIPRFEDDGSLPVLDSTALLEHKELPGSMVIVGGGVIGVEFASIYSAFGVRITIVEMLDRLLTSAEAEISELLHKRFRSEGIDIKTSTGFSGIKNGEVLLSDGTAVSTDAVLIAVGRRASTSAVSGESGVELDASGFVKTGADLSTTVPGVYAIGDLTGKSLLAHTASAQALQLAENLFGKEKRELNYDTIPCCVFTEPEIAWAGLTEAEAVKRGIPVKTGKVPFRAVGKALTIGESEGFIKVVADGRWDEIIGVHMIGPHVSDLIAEVSAAMQLESTSEDLSSVVHPHPTLSEALMEACEAVHGKSIHFKN